MTTHPSPHLTLPLPGLPAEVVISESLPPPSSPELSSVASVRPSFPLSDPGAFSPAPLEPPGSSLPHSSIFVQLDWWCNAVLRKRLFHDFCANNYSESLCPSYGPLPWAAPTSTQFCLFAPRSLSDLPSLIELVQSQAGTGVFAFPAAPKHGRSLNFTPFKTAYKTLLEYSRPLLSFTFLGPNTLPRGYSSQVILSWCAFVVSFASAGSRPRRKPNRPELTVALEPQLSGAWPVRVGDRPFGPIQVSPQPYLPKTSDDVLPGGKPFPVSSILPAQVRKSRWNVTAFSELAASYPFADVLAIANATVSDTGLPSSFAGRRDKCVMNANMVHEESELAILRALFMKDVDKGLMAGPFSECPFPAVWCPNSQPRFSPAGVVPKDKWEANPTKFRPVVHHSKGVKGTDVGSQNGLTYSPKFVRFSLTANHVRDRLAALGLGVQVSLTDLVAYFRMNILCADDLHLFVYLLGKEFFADLFNCFGFRPAEWGAAAISAVLQWGLSQPHLGICSDTSFLDVYVDNIKFYSGGSVPDHEVRFAKLCSILDLLGCSLHEFKSGPRFRSLGWDYDLESWSFSCPLDKWTVVGSHLRELSLRALDGHPLSTRSVEKIVGFLWWASCAAPAITPLIYALSSVSEGASPLVSVPLKEVEMFSLLRLTQFWASWDRSRSIFHGFTPTHQAQVRVYLDASTVVGCGGWVAENGHAFAHVWTDLELAAMSRAGDGTLAMLQSRSSTFAELRGFEYALERFGEYLRGKRVAFTFDSEASVKALRKGYSSKGFILGILTRVLTRLLRFAVIPVFDFVHRVHNQVADALSNNLFQPAATLALEIHGVSLEQVQIDFSLFPPQEFSLEKLKASFRQ